MANSSKTAELKSIVDTLAEKLGAQAQNAINENRKAIEVGLNRLISHHGTLAIYPNRQAKILGSIKAEITALSALLAVEAKHSEQALKEVVSEVLNAALRLGFAAI